MAGELFINASHPRWKICKHCRSEAKQLAHLAWAAASHRRGSTHTRSMVGDQRLQQLQQQRRHRHQQQQRRQQQQPSAISSGGISSSISHQPSAAAAAGPTWNSALRRTSSTKGALKVSSGDSAGSPWHLAGGMPHCRRRDAGMRRRFSLAVRLEGCAASAAARAEAATTARTACRGSPRAALQGGAPPPHPARPSTYCAVLQSLTCQRRVNSLRPPMISKPSR